MKLDKYDMYALSIIISGGLLIALSGLILGRILLPNIEYPQIDYESDWYEPGYVEKTVWKRSGEDLTGATISVEDRDHIGYIIPHVIFKHGGDETWIFRGVRATIKEINPIYKGEKISKYKIKIQYYPYLE